MTSTNAGPIADPTDVMGRRVGAYLVDGLLAMVLLLAVAVPLFLQAIDQRSFVDDAAAQARCDVVNQVDDGTGPAADPPRDGEDGLCLALGDTTYELRAGDLGSTLLAVYGVSFLTGALNSVVVQGLTGASIGKYLFRLRVVREDGRPIGIGWALLRNLVGVVDGIAGGVVGLVVASTTRGHRRVGDLAASSYVVDRTAMGAPVVLPPAPGPSAPPPPVWDPNRGTYVQYDWHRATWIQWDPAAACWQPLRP